MDFFDVVDKRRSVRKYSQDQVPASVLEKAVDAALLAPNSSNMQPWEFYCVTNADKKRELAKACLSQPSATTAAALIVAVARRDRWRQVQGQMLKAFEQNGITDPKTIGYYKNIVPMVYNHGPLGVFGVFKKLFVGFQGLFKPMPRGPFSYREVDATVVKTTALACQNLMNAITAQGYDSCPMEGFDEVRVKNMLDIRGKARVVMVISCGKADPEGIYGKRVRMPKEQFVHMIH
jgi:nitroreductase